MNRKLSELRVCGAKVNNLKHVDLKLPHSKLIVVCGVSGSGKTSFVYDVIHFEAQRRLRAAMNQGIDGVVVGGNLQRTRSIEGLLPSICLKQGAKTRHSDFNVAKTANVYDLLSSLFVHAGEGHCLACLLYTSPSPRDRG